MTTTDEPAGAQEVEEPAEDTGEDGGQQATHTRTIPVKGREITVRRPTPEQIVVWRRVLQRLQRTRDGSTAHDLIDVYGRLRRVVDSVIVEEADIDWVDDQMLDGEMTISDTISIVVDAVAAFARKNSDDGKGGSGRSGGKSGQTRARRR